MQLNRLWPDNSEKVATACAFAAPIHELRLGMLEAHVLPLCACPS